MSIAEKLPREQCTGCGLCSQICPIKCIAMKEDSEGFLFPNVDNNQCVHCSLCTKKCPILSDSVIFSDSGKAKYYAAIIKNEEELKLASSGGVFSVLADLVLRKGGSVCGCVYNERMEAVHVVSKEHKTIVRMYGSKYVQSNILDCYEIIKRKLENREKVLFSGTACQVAALKSFLEIEYEGLYTVDILCHGVPSPGLFRLFVKNFDNMEDSRVVEIKFRDKEKNGWGSEHRTSVTYQNGKKIWPFMPAYFSAFFYGLDLRESCYQCKFTRTNRVSDITIGDYWGSWKKYGKRFREGISVISINTNKGIRLFDSIIDKLDFNDHLEQEDAILSNDSFVHSVDRPKERDTFYKKLNKYNKLWIRTYFTKTCIKKTLVSIYGAIIPEKIRIFLHMYLCS